MRRFDPPPFPRVQVLPGLDRASFRVDDVERVGYDFGIGRPRPCFFPVIGPSGRMLTRVGHPNPVGHEHHRSIWFGHQSVDGINFWEERAGSDVQVRHARVVLYHDGPDWGGLVAELEWTSRSRVVMRQRLVAVLEPKSDGGLALDLQSRFSAPGSTPVTLGKTNFGFLGVRVARSMSVQFGGGTLTGDDGATGEPALFGRPHSWVDYAGPVAADRVEGIAYFDHPSNPRHPSPWHVRSDGWMEAAFNLAESYLVPPDHPLDLRYRLLVHPGPADRPALDRAWAEFAALPAYEVVPPKGNVLASLSRGPAA